MRSNSKGGKPIIVIGVLLIIIGVIFNEWFISALLLQHGMVRILLARVAIWFFDVLCIVTGIYLIIRRPQLRFNLRSLLFLAVSFILFLFIMEAGLRVVYFIMNKINYRTRDFSEYLGWRSVENVYWKRKYKGFGEIEFSTTKYGFRVFGNTHTKKKKILVLGDSFTEARTVSDGFTYYDYLKNHHDSIEVFAYGCGGYGSLQEYMILDKHYDEIKPDLVLWQFHSNDIFNNDYELESSMIAYNDQMTRPYYRNGRIEWLYPVRSGKLFASLLKNSYLLRVINKRLQILELEKDKSLAKLLYEDNPLIKKGVNTTIEIMGLVRKRVGAIPIVAFSTDNKPWVGNAFQDVCDEHGIHYLPIIPHEIERTEESGIVVIGSDGHWNDVGHAMAGQIILDYLLENNLLNKE